MGITQKRVSEGLINLLKSICNFINHQGININENTPMGIAKVKVLALLRTRSYRTLAHCGGSANWYTYLEKLLGGI
jgi:hypothetical protein